MCKFTVREIKSFQTTNQCKKGWLTARVLPVEGNKRDWIAGIKSKKIKRK